jgi:ElaB/YqjD/DUF883 family membrane-anchored ribosome-binding protein
MATATTGAATAIDAIKERLAPALGTLDERMRQGRRAFVRGQHAAEDATAAAARIVKRRPLRTVMIAAAVGALTGGALGFGLGWLTRTRN